MKFWPENKPKSHNIALINMVIVIVAMLAQRVVFFNDVWFNRLSPLFRAVEFVNYPAYALAELPGAMSLDGMVGFPFAFVLFVGGAYAWARFLCWVLRVDSYELNRKEPEGGESRF